MTIPAPAFTMPGTAPAPAPAVPGPAPISRLDEAAKKYRALRDKKKEIQDRHKEELAPYNDAMAQLETQFLDYLNQTGQQSAKTPGGTVYRTTRTTYTVDDPSAFREWVESAGRPDFYENRVSKEALEAYIEEGGQLPPGLKVSSFTTVNVRK